MLLTRKEKRKQELEKRILDRNRDVYEKKKESLTYKMLMITFFVLLPILPYVDTSMTPGDLNRVNQAILYSSFMFILFGIAVFRVDNNMITNIIISFKSDGDLSFDDKNNILIAIIITLGITGFMLVDYSNIGSGYRIGTVAIIAFAKIIKTILFPRGN